MSDKEERPKEVIIKEGRSVPIPTPPPNTNNPKDIDTTENKEKK